MLDLIIHATMKMLQICESKVQMIHLTPCTEICIHVHSDTPYTDICIHSNDREVGWGWGGGGETCYTILSHKHGMVDCN